jgi:hypothetical protein
MRPRSFISGNICFEFSVSFFAVLLNKMGHFQEKEKMIKAIIVWLMTHQLKEGGG